jgi:hypothetical protein
MTLVHPALADAVPKPFWLDSADAPPGRRPPISSS